MAIDHVARARLAWPHLARRASRQEPPCTYVELCDKLGLHPRAARYFLGVIQNHCKLRGWPALQALAVRKNTRLPGPGYFGSARTRVDHQRMLQEVYEHSWPPKAPF